jgi:2-methylcitrate dehydratase PrpD
MEPQDLERWIHQHKDDTDAQLRATVDRMVKHCVDYHAALELLDRREKARRSEDHAIAAKRHQELNDRLAALEKPHWTTTPVFWVTLAGAVAAGLASYFGWLALQP